MLHFNFEDEGKLLGKVTNKSNEGRGRPANVTLNHPGAMSPS